MDGRRSEFSRARDTILGWDLPLLSVRLETLDNSGEVLGNATGFLLESGSDCFLITNWHVVSGFTYPKISASKKGRPEKLRYHHKNVQAGPEGRTSIGESIIREIPLFEGDRPLWYQQAPNPEFETPHKDKFQIPYNIDVVAIPIFLEIQFRRFLCLNSSDVTQRRPELGERVVIVGYPHGCSVLDSTPEPLVVTRHTAAIVTERPFTLLADGIGARGMSGSPVYTANGQHFYLLGVYQGAVIADDELHLSRVNDFYASLGAIERATDAFAFIDELVSF